MFNNQNNNNIFIMDLVNDLKWRGLVSNITKGTSEQLAKESTTFYVGTDPTGKSLHVGHLLAFIVAKLLQQHGHKPIVVVGGATASLGDPSFKDEERRLMSREEIESNANNIKKQLSKILDFDGSEPNSAIMVNNYQWMKDFSFLDFSREIGKLITVNYMMSKDSVQTRLAREGSGLSFTEFTYQLLQGYDFLHLYQTQNCKMQIGGSDQWGNITTGQEIIRKKLGQGNDVFAIVWPLATKSDGRKFGKSEGGKNIWLDPEMTSPYEFYQFWLNQSDDDAKKYIKMFTLMPREEIEALIAKHDEEPHLRLIQKRLAEEVTTMVHSKKDCDIAIASSNIIFGKDADIDFASLGPNDLMSIFSGVPQFIVRNQDVNGIKLIDLLTTVTLAFKSKNEVRKLVMNGGLYVNRCKVSNVDFTVSKEMLIHDKYLIIQQGKKNYKIIEVLNE